MLIFIIMFFSFFSIILTELYFQAIVRAKSIQNSNKRDFVIISIYVIFISMILTMCIVPDYVPRNSSQFPHGVGLVAMIPIFNMGAYGLVNIKKVIEILGTKTSNHKD